MAVKQEKKGGKGKKLMEKKEKKGEDKEGKGGKDIEGNRIKVKERNRRMNLIYELIYELTRDYETFEMANVCKYCKETSRTGMNRLVR